MNDIKAVEREDFTLVSHAGAIFKADVETTLNAISRKQLVEQIKAFVQKQPQWVEVWNAHFRKNHLPEKFVVAFIFHVSENPTIKIK